MKRLLVALAILAFTAPAFAARRRAVGHPAAAGPCTPGVLAADYNSNDVAVDANYVYFGDDVVGLYRMAKDGTGLTHLADIPDGSLSLLVQDDKNLYFFSDESDSGLPFGILYSMPKGGGTLMPLVTQVSLPYDLRIDATSLYWTSLGTTPDFVSLNSDGTVEKINKDGTGRVLLASKLSGASSLAVDDTTVWFGEAGVATNNRSAGLRSVPKSGGNVTQIANGATVVSIDLTATDVWFSTTDLNSSAGILYRRPKSGGAPVIVVSGDTTPLDLHVVGSTIYYIASGDVDETITSLPLAGAPNQAAVRAPQAAVCEPHSAIPAPQLTVRAPQAAVRAPHAAVPVPRTAVRVPQAAVPVPHTAVRAPHAAAHRRP